MEITIIYVYVINITDGLHCKMAAISVLCFEISLILFRNIFDFAQSYFGLIQDFYQYFKGLEYNQRKSSGEGKYCSMLSIFIYY